MDYWATSLVLVLVIAVVVLLLCRPKLTLRVVERKVKVEKDRWLAVVDKNGVAVEDAQEVYIKALRKYKEAVLAAKYDRDIINTLATIENTIAVNRLAELDALEESYKILAE